MAGKGIIAGRKPTRVEVITKTATRQNNSRFFEHIKRFNIRPGADFGFLPVETVNQPVEDHPLQRGVKHSGVLESLNVGGGIKPTVGNSRTSDGCLGFPGSGSLGGFGFSRSHASFLSFCGSPLSALTKTRKLSCQRKIPKLTRFLAKLPILPVEKIWSFFGFFYYELLNRSALRGRVTPVF